VGGSKSPSNPGDRKVNILRDWLAKPTSDPAARCAATVVERHDLRPPVDVFGLANEYCDLEYETWPFACDALAVGLDRPRPKVFIRKNGIGTRRRRFTMGHELGHVIPAWHVGRMVCSPVRAAFDAEVTRQEAEANRFAGALLVPRRFLEEHADRQVGDVVSVLDEAEVSAAAAMLALAHNLLPGFCFLVDEDEDGFRLIRSSGTRVPGGTSRRPQIAQLRDKAHAFSEAEVSGRRVLWFQFAGQSDVSLPEDLRKTTDILKDSLASVAALSEVPKLATSINGIVGGMLSKGDRAQSASQALAVLEHRFASDPALQHLMEVPDFQLYLRRKAIDRVKRSSSLQMLQVEGDCGGRVARTTERSRA